jgi:hypothetical protein
VVAEVKTRVSTIVLRDDGIIFVDMWAGVEFNEGDAHETLAKIDALTGGEPARHCVDFRKAKSMTRECREIFANGKNTKAAALVVSNPLSRVIGNFFLGLSKTAFPLRLFGDVEPAIAWLHTL